MSAFVFVAPDARHRPRERAPAMAAIAALEAAYRVVYYEVANHDDYSRGLRAVWTDPGTLINVEHDMAPTLAQLDELVACPEPLCAWVYWMAPATTGRLRPLLSSEDGDGGNHGYALRAAPGCCKIAHSKRRGELPTICNYHGVESEIWRVCGGPWHLHYPPMLHYHGFMEAPHGRVRSEPIATV